ncbi:hypothetical protein LJB42_003572 [Komagataella kurtzmanii]|nr:hypothetical protein LJB42_003572 [Komagataella kurtzmanii]
MKLSRIIVPICFCLSRGAIALSAYAHDGSHGGMDMDMNMSRNSVTAETTETATDQLSGSADSETAIPSIEPVPFEEHHHHGLPILDTDLSPAERLYWENYNTTTYFTVESNSTFFLYAHVISMVVTFVFLYPVCLVLNNLKNKWYLPALSVHAIVTVLSLISYSIFIDSVPDLYPNNAYTKMGVVLFVFTVVHFVSAVIYQGSKFFAVLPSTPTDNSHAQFLPLKDLSNKEHNKKHEVNSTSSTLFDYEARDSHSKQFRSQYRDSLNNSFQLDDREANFSIDNSSNGTIHDVPSIPSQNHDSYSNKVDGALQRLFEVPWIARIAVSLGSVASVVFNLLNFGIFFFFLIYFPTGVAVLNCLGMANTVFNLLAHFIKGGVFFSLGLLSLARYCGGFQKLGWAWNYSFINRYEKKDSIWFRFQPRNVMITMEMLESSLILFYGCTNVFMEHLSNPGGEWAAKDLQHVSIAFMYIGCGLCGVITELKLNNWRLIKFQSTVEEINNENEPIDAESFTNVTCGFSPNPFPAFTIFWTGLLMSQHAQASELSTSIHVQWGSLLTYGSLFRIATMLYLMFNKTYKGDLFQPSRPLTELVTSFCLLCGGLVFAESTDPIVLAMAYRGLTGMFTLNVSVGVVALLMAWIMTVFSIKDHLKR